MATLDARSDLAALIKANLDMTNVTSLTTRPKVLINGNTSTDSGGDYDSGTFDLGEERYNYDRQSNIYRRERFTIEATFIIHDQDDDTSMREILADLDRLLGVESFDITANYDHYAVTYTIFGDRGTIEADLVFVMIKEIQAVNV